MFHWSMKATTRTGTNKHLTCSCTESGCDPCCMFTSLSNWLIFELEDFAADVQVAGLDFIHTCICGPIMFQLWWALRLIKLLTHLIMLTKTIWRWQYIFWIFIDFISWLINTTLRDMALISTVVLFHWAAGHNRTRTTQNRDKIATVIVAILEMIHSGHFMLKIQSSWLTRQAGMCPFLDGCNIVGHCEIFWKGGIYLVHCVALSCSNWSSVMFERKWTVVD